MKIYEENNNLIIENIKDFDLTQTFDCGQCFRWELKDGAYTGVVKNKALRICQKDDKIILEDTSKKDWDNVFCEYFDFVRDYGKIKKCLSCDDKMKEAISFGKGIRILRQEPFEALISFIISASNNIPRIKKIITLLCENFGDEIYYQGKTYYSFPTAERLSKLTLSEIEIIRSGFRGKYILSAAEAVASGRLDLECLKKSSFEYAKSELLKLSGVGNKVAECVLLFGLGKTSGFPVDVWIKRIMEYCYFEKEVPAEEISRFAKEKFGELGGFAQQYLFYWARENKIGV